jgi:hypothetical protein
MVLPRSRHLGMSRLRAALSSDAKSAFSRLGWAARSGSDNEECHSMGIFDEVEKLLGSNQDEVKKVTGEAEQYANSETGGQFSSEIDAAGNQADSYIEGQGSNQ